ncbi:hypothetical protein QMZ92_16440 [Streptomyces sp. HNM0645]|uniref:DUF6197 family protein n=1 Tax=Streptomyces sp. HNM0645 TaxID=2782343 RepID=UPI0024B7DACC|nr:hypothetical protein [Streptomyces sp. HNM0645]MDI9885924.1 hypothetical protein [Streptomyces sp. HNM0645]
MRASTATETPAVTPAAPLDFDERLRLAVLAVDARIDTRPLDLADVIRTPVEEPNLQPAAALAAVLRRARARILRDGWTTGHCRGQRAMCAYEAIRAEAANPAQAADATALLLDTIRREFPHAATVPAWNDEQRHPAVVLRMLDTAARAAEQRDIRLSKTTNNL